MEKIRAGVLLIALLIVLTAIFVNVQFPTVSAQIVPNAPSSLLFGYSPTTLSSPQDGIPVYSISDQMWAESVANQSVGITLISPSGASVVSTTLNPNTASLIYTFQSSDQEGIWTLSINSQQGGNSLPVLVVNPDNHPLDIGLAYFSLQNSQLNLGFNVSQTSDYNIQGCLPAGALPTAVTLQVPSNLGGGSLQIAWNGSSSSLTEQGNVSQPFTFWYDLYSTYAYSSLNSTQLVSRDLQVAKSNAVLFTASSTAANASLVNEAPLRDGRYTLRAFFESASGLGAVETKLLITGTQVKSWIPLSSCSPFAISAPSNFQQSVSLTGIPAQWPRQFLYMYEVDGVDAFGALPLNVQLARINFFGTPWNVSLSDMTFEVANNSAIETTSEAQGSIYLAASRFPLRVTVEPSFGGRALQPLSVDIAAPFADYTRTVAIGKIVASVTENGSPLNGVPVQLLNSNNATLIQLVTSRGNATFYVPAGSYQLKSTVGGATDYAQTSVAAYGQSSAVLAFATKQPPQPFLIYAASIMAVLGVVLNAYVWIARPIMKHHRIAGTHRVAGKAFTRF